MPVPYERMLTNPFAYLRGGAAVMKIFAVRHSRMEMCPCMASFIRSWNAFPGMWIKLR